MSTTGRIIKITVFHHSSRHEVSLPAESTFGDVKRLLAHKTGLEPEEQTLIFRGKEKQEEEHLHLEDVKDNSEIFLFKEAASRGRKLEENRKKIDMLKAFEAVAGVRADVDQLSESVAALEVAIKCGTNVAENEFLTLSELLMSKLLKLDAIPAEGEARLQRKAEVCRVQSIVDKLDSLKEINSTPSSNNGNAFPDRNGGTFNSGTGSMNAPPPLSSSGESIINSEPFTYTWDTGFELRGTDEAEDPSTSEALVRRGRRLDSGARVWEGTERRASSGVSELEEYSAQPDFDDFQAHVVEFPRMDVMHEISQFPGQIETGTSQTLPNDGFLYSRSRSVPARASTSEDYSEEDTYINVGEILRLISPSLAVTEASANVSTNVAKSLAMLCELDDKATKLLEIAFNKYPSLMNVRSDRRKTFIRWMFSSLSNLLQLLSTVSTSGTLNAQKKSEIEVVIGELETFGFDAGFIGEMHSQVSEAWEARLAEDNAPSELKTLCSRAEDLNQEIASLERSLAAAKAEVAQIENRISALCELAEVEENHSPIFNWIIE
ncbi:hypothetical protein QN277_025195 [Acacia crassicarpa]|uniref:Uncharacterized protein n=1 Tax=Acacia crassicarpa TaxID=499986 RepID=A0AAE1MI52_9FABA|nr:hypothetical protein QN277_025195 [Acacia crassicarpa]